MSTTVLPPLPKVGGFLTQKVLESIHGERTHDAWRKPAKRTISDKQFSVQGFSPTHQIQSNEIKDTAKYRNTFMHNLCVEMLKDGFHLAFRDLFNLIKTEKELVDENFDHTLTSIEDSPDNLTFIKERLIAVELATRQGHSEEIYEAQLALSKFFENYGNFRLAHHFYTSSFNTSKQIRGDGRRREAEANYNLGKTAEREKDYLLAKKLYEEYFVLTADKPWNNHGETLQTHARDCLTRVFITLSEELTPEDDITSLEYLHKAYDLVKGGGYTSSMSYVGYLLGNKYDSDGNHEKAVEYLTEYLELCKTRQDNVGMGKAFQALAYAHRRQGNMEEAAGNLKLFLKTMETSGDSETLRDACSDLGALYNYTGKYEQSSNYYKRAYQMAQNENNSDNVESSRCEYGMALAHGLFNGAVESLVKSNKTNMELLLYWKSERVQGFSNDMKTYSMYSQLESILEQKKLVKDASSSNNNNNNTTVNAKLDNSVDMQEKEVSLETEEQDGNIEASEKVTSTT